MHSPLQTHTLCHFNSLHVAKSKAKYLCTSLVRSVWQLIPFVPETFGVGVVALFGAGVVVVWTKLKVDLEISERSITEI